MHLRLLKPHLRRFCSPSASSVFHIIKHTSPESTVIPGVSEWVLDRPEARNALSLELIRRLEDAVEESKNDQALRCVVIRSSSPGIFCAGADLKERRKMTLEEASNTVKRLRSVFDKVSKIRCPVIAVLDGAALGGGAELALSCDIRIGSPLAKFAFPETRLGIIPGAGGTQRLPRLVGPSNAKDLIFTGRSIGAEESRELGLLNKLGEDPMDYALSLARDVCSAGPIGVRLAKQAIDEGHQKDIEGGLELESRCYEKTLTTDDRLEGLNAFNEKRKPIFKGV